MAKKRALEDDASTDPVKEQLNHFEKEIGSTSGSPTAEHAINEGSDDAFGKDCGVEGEAAQDMPPGREEAMRDGKVVLASLPGAKTDEGIRVAVSTEPKGIDNGSRASPRHRRAVRKHVETREHVGMQQTAEAKPSRGDTMVADKDEPIRTRGYYDQKYPNAAATLQRKKRRLERDTRAAAEEQAKQQEEQQRQIKADAARVKRNMEKKYGKGYRLG